MRRQLHRAPAREADAHGSRERVLLGHYKCGLANLIDRSDDEWREALVTRGVRVVCFDLPANLRLQARMRRGQRASLHHRTRG